MKKIFLNNYQMCILSECINSTFIINEYSCRFVNQVLAEGFRHKPNFLPHKALARMLTRGYRYVNNERVPCRRLYAINQSEIDNMDNGMSVSYYFEFTFNIDGVNKKGVIRISDHKAIPQTFEKKGVEYALSIVIKNSSNDIRTPEVPSVNIWEYISQKDTEEELPRELHDLTIKILTLVNIEIVDDKVVAPSGLDFKKVGGLEEGKKYMLMTKSKRSKTIGRLVTFKVMGEGGSDCGEVRAIQTKTGYSISDEDREKFKFGDTLHYYYFPETSPVPISYGVETI